MQDYKIVKFEVALKVTNEDIEDIFSAAFCDGIAYWAGLKEAEGFACPEEMAMSEFISKGNKAILYDIEDKSEEWILNSDVVIAGIERYISEGNKPYNIICEDTVDNALAIDTGMVDSAVADMIIQYGLFSKLIYG